MLKWRADFDALGELSGTLAGIEHITQNEDRYMNALLRDAHNQATEKFDMAAIASASVISHMFEFGTVGVTPGAKRLSPFDKRSHLWGHILEGQGKDVNVTFKFKPAVMPNPMPTTAATGVPSKYLKRISRRKYFFWNKAFVMESGQEVSIRPKRGPFLFVPFYGQPATGTNAGSSRGYMMWNAKRLGPIKVRPGAQSRGNFGLVWNGWWNSTGANMMGNEVYKNYERDFSDAINAAATRSSSVFARPLTRGMTAPAYKSSKSQTISYLMQKAVGRLRRNR